MYLEQDFIYEKPERWNFNTSAPIFFTADTHFYDTYAFRLSKRPFASVSDMNDALIENWNRVVPKDGIVFHLGDFCAGGKSGWKNAVEALNGKIYLILGNHDYTQIRAGYKNLFEEVSQQKYVRIHGQPILMNHYPFLCYEHEHQNTWQLFGHVHSGANMVHGFDIPRLNMLFPLQYDVGVDNNDYTPVSFELVKDRIFRQQQLHKNKPRDAVTGYSGDGRMEIDAAERLGRTRR